MQINWPNKITRWHDKNQWQFWLFRPLLWVYRVVCHGFRLTERNDYCQVNFDSFRSNHHFLRQLEPEAKPPLWILAKLSLSKSMILTVEFQKPIAFSIYQTSLWSSPTSHSIIIRRERTNQTKNTVEPRLTMSSICDDSVRSTFNDVANIFKTF